jgi:hypothetical protein
MDKADQDMTNASLLLHEKINERIAEAMKDYKVVGSLVESYEFRRKTEEMLAPLIFAIVNDAVKQMSARLYPVQTYSTGTTSITSGSGNSFNARSLW